MVGRLQTNKVKKAINIFDFIHSLDSIKLADALKEGINEVLVKVEGFGGVENVHFTSFVLQ